MKFLVAPLILTGAFGVNAAEMILGLPLGGELDRPIQACVAIVDRTSRVDYCGTIESYPAKVDREMFLQRPFKADFPLPSWVLAKDIHVSVSNGIIGRIAAKTQASRQDDVIESIGTKFGAPAHVALVNKKNALGATWTVREADWETPTIYVATFCGRIDECTILFMSPEAKAESDRQRAERRAGDKL